MTPLLWIQIVIAILLSLCILVQHRASGLTSTFGGSGAVAVQRRGAEKVIYKLTIWLSVLFFGLTIVEWFLV
ncbi:MAG: Uncharacterized protein Greene041619_1091 [Candidatus Peregrinibacteria bacterium Greene0416_19]|nr:MAG: Uncharacterized protein Greene041619_1091 [Candidatus Peregrinibacteria bacterium Greene0416_19]